MAKKAALLGLGIENLALAKHLLDTGTEITICDRRTADELGERLAAFRRAGVELQLGPGYLDSLHRFDTVFRSPGLPLFEPALEAARAAGVEITSAIRLFFDLCPVPIVGVTGSKGKGTTASLIFHILQHENQERAGRVWLGGNIGVAPFNFLEQIGPDDLVVLELSSFQLEDAHKSPKIAVITNIFPEHLKSSDPNNPNYHRSMADYVAAKANILRHAPPGAATAVLNADNDACRALAAEARGETLWFSLGEVPEGAFVADRGRGRRVYLRRHGVETDVCGADEVQIRGEHNLQNVCAALAAASAAGAGAEAMREAVTAFKGLEHRLEFVREADGIKYYDDSFATTPEASAVALRAFGEPVVLIAGGADKGSDYRPYAEAILEGRVRAVILIGAMAGRIRGTIEALAQEMKKPPPRLVEGSDTMPAIVAAARDLARAGDVVLLSTACASFGLFKNYKERGDLFKQAVREMAERP